MLRAMVGLVAMNREAAMMAALVALIVAGVAVAIGAVTLLVRDRRRQRPGS